MADPKNPSPRGRFRRRAAGFTLVELLVVIGIIALLISILLPALTRARMAASTLACQSNLHSIGQGLMIYAGDNHGTLPYGWWDGGWPNGTPSGGYDPSKENDWVTLTIASLNGKYSATANDVATNGSITTRMRGMFLCPDAPGQGVITVVPSSITHYGSNPRLMPILSAPYQPASPALPYVPYKLAHIKRSAEVGLIFDLTLAHNNADPSDTWEPYNTIPVAYCIDGGNHPTSNGGGITDNTHLTDDYSQVSYTAGQPINMTTPALVRQQYNYNCDNITKNVWNVRFRHMKNTVANVLMVDGHVQSFHYNPQTYVTDLLHLNVHVNQ